MSRTTCCVWTSVGFGCENFDIPIVAVTAVKLSSPCLYSRVVSMIRVWEAAQPRNGRTSRSISSTVRKICLRGQPVRGTRRHLVSVSYYYHLFSRYQRCVRTWTRNLAIVDISRSPSRKSSGRIRQYKIIDCVLRPTVPTDFVHYEYICCIFADTDNETVQCTWNNLQRLLEVIRMSVISYQLSV